MEEYSKQQLSEYLTAAENAIALNNYKSARRQFLKAAEAALILAKGKNSETRDQYIKVYEKCLLFADKAALKDNMISKETPKIKETDSATDLKVEVTTSEQKPTGSSSYGNKTITPVTLNNRSNQPKSKPQYKQNYGDSLSPKWLKDYFGQNDAVAQVKPLIDAAKLTNKAIPHLIIYGSHGLGKTTFARIIANELGVTFKEINVSGINVQGMITILKDLKPRDIIFIDEIHTLPKEVAESVLYSALQDRRITYLEGKGKFAQSKTMTLPPFTLIGATTELGELPKPFTQRSTTIRLKEYSDEVLATIILKSFYRAGMAISEEDARYISKRCRNNPRVANNTVNMIFSRALVKYAHTHGISGGVLDSVEEIKKCKIFVTRDVIDEFFKDSKIDEYGLEEGDRQLLKIIITRYGGGPVSIDTLARAMNESNNVLKGKYEAYLIKKGMLQILPQGRIAMPRAYKVLGLAKPSPSYSKYPKKSDENSKREYSRDKNEKSDINVDSNKEHNSHDLSGSGGNCLHGEKNDDIVSGDDDERPIMLINTTENEIDDTEDCNENESYCDEENEGECCDRDYTEECQENRNDNAPRWEKRVITTCIVPDVEKCRLIESLITYPENAGSVDRELDELFPDVVKEYDEVTKHRCELEVNIDGKKRLLECDSFLESRFASLLAKTGFLRDIKAQTVEMEYVSQQLANHKYFPDFVIKDYKGRIAVIEMKNYQAATYHLNIDKYDELKRYCVAKGYGYAEIMKPNDAKGYISAEMIKNASVNKELEQFIIDTINRNGAETGHGYFTSEDFIQYKKRFGNADESEVYTILFNNRRLRNEDRNGVNMAITLN